MRLVKRFHYSELLSHNKCLGNPSIYNGRMIYRDTRDNNPLSPVNDNTQALKICNIDENYVCSNFSTIKNTQDHRILSDSIFFTHKEKTYIRTTKVSLKEVPYTCEIDLIDLEKKELCNLIYKDKQKQEKNWGFISYNDSVYISYGYKNNTHKVLKCNLDTKEISNFRETEFYNPWSEQFGTLKNTSNFVLHDGYLWNIGHSHNYPNKHWVYTINIILLNPKPPFRVARISNVPLFKYSNGYTYNTILFPSHLYFHNDKMYIGLSISSPYYMDIIEFDKEDIQDHLLHNKSFEYPADYPFFPYVIT